MKWFKALMALFSALRIGSELRSAAAWKNAQVVASFLTAMMALATILGYDLKLDDETITGGAVFIAAIVNGLLVAVTSKKVGLPSKRELNNTMPVNTNLDYPGRDDSKSYLERIGRTGSVSANPSVASMAVETDRRPVVRCSGDRRCVVAGGVHQSVSSVPKPSNLSTVRTEPDPVAPVVTGWGDRD
jgi:hypothetical protein